MTKPRSYLAVLCLFLFTHLSAQCPMSLTCEGAGFLPSIDALNGYTCSNPTIPNVSFPFPNLCFGVGVPHNVGWWGFVGPGGPLIMTLNFDQSQCDRGQGIQMGVFEGYCDGSAYWDCNASCNTSNFSLSGATRRGTPYFVWVDGCNGDVCDFTVTTNRNGVGVVFPDSIGPITKSGDVCPCGDFTVCPPDLGDFIPAYTWLVNDTLIGRDECEKILVPEDAQPGDLIEVCLTMTLGNPYDPQNALDTRTICQNFVVQPIQIALGRCQVVCHEDQPYIWNGAVITSSCISPPCTVRVQTPSGCCVDSIKPIIFLPPPAVGQKDTFICSFDVPFRAENGREYFGPVCDEVITFERRVINPLCPTSRVSCDTSYLLTVGRPTYFKDWEVDCGACSGMATLCPNITLGAHCPGYDQRIDYSLIWTNENTGDTLGMTRGEDCLEVSAPGRFCIDIIASLDGVPCGTVGKECIDINDLFLPEPPSIIGDLILCSPTGIYEVERDSQICEYRWTITQGDGIILTPNSLDSNRIEVDWTSSTEETGLVCLDAVGDCGQRTTCATIYLDSLLTVGYDFIIFCPGDSVLLTAGKNYNNLEWSTGDSTRAIFAYEEGEYCVTGQAGDSTCFEIQCFNLQKVEVSVIDEVITPDNGSGNGGITLSLSSNDGIQSSMWNTGDTTLTLTDLDAGPYSLTVVTDSGCEFVFDFTVPMSTSTTGLDVDQIFFISPNPGSMLTLWPLDQIKEIAEVSLSSADGRTIPVWINENRVNGVSDLPNGIYLLSTVGKDGSQQVLKWVKTD